MDSFVGMVTTAQSPIFTLGYQQRSIQEYLEELDRADIDLVVDVRENAWSRKPGFSRSELEDRLNEAGIDYIHLRFAGNPKQLRRQATSHAACLADYDRHIQENPGIVERFAEYISAWMVAGIKACLLCYERHPDDCHRTVLLRHTLQAVDRSIQIKHLGPDGAERFS